MIIKNNKVVFVDYTLKNESGTVIDTSFGKKPLGFIHGAGQIISGLEQILLGRSQGDSLTTVVMPEDGYGLINDDLIKTVPIDHFNDRAQLKVGAQFHLDGPQKAVAKVVNVENDIVTLDLNHPLAGQSLYFDINIIEVRDATLEELNQLPNQGNTSAKESCCSDPNCPSAS